MADAIYKAHPIQLREYKVCHCRVVRMKYFAVETLCSVLNYKPVVNNIM